jgi:hypothetical protein
MGTGIYFLIFKNGANYTPISAASIAEMVSIGSAPFSRNHVHAQGRDSLRDSVSEGRIGKAPTGLFPRSELAAALATESLEQRSKLLSCPGAEGGAASKRDPSNPLPSPESPAN